jgi:hypothetical protein
LPIQVFFEFIFITLISMESTTELRRAILYGFTD